MSETKEVTVKTPTDVLVAGLVADVSITDRALNKFNKKFGSIFASAQAKASLAEGWRRGG